MARLCDDSDSDLPDIADLMRLKPQALPTIRASPQKTNVPLSVSKTDVKNSYQHDISKAEPHQASLRLQNNEPKRQRPLKKISNNVVSLPAPFGTPGRKRPGNLDSIEGVQDERILRRSPSRKARIVASTKMIEVEDSSSEQEDSDASFVDLCSSSEEEEVSINVDIWTQPKPRPQRLPKQNETKAESKVPSDEPPTRRSPIKGPLPQSRPRTPSPPPSPSKPKLISPSKTTNRIPPTPHRPSIDAFWAPDVVNAWNEQYSPRKELTSPRKKRFVIFDSDEDEDRPLSPIASPRKSPTKSSGSPVKKDKAASEARKAFEARKTQIATEFLAELDEKIASGRIAELAASTGGVKIVWSRKLNSTAGRAHWRRECFKVGSEDGGAEKKEYRHHASIELAEKVINDEHRLINVLAHEFCHLVNFMISGVKGNPHGKEFKEWGRKCMRCFGDRGVEVTTKHSYEIEYRFVWECVSCGMEFKRHSKSVDVERHSCGVCKEKLVQTKPPVRSVKKTDYQVFVKENFARVKRENPEASHGLVMGILGKMYREQKKGVSLVKDEVEELKSLTKTFEVITLDG